jgi:hypothetical protein
MEFIFRDDCFTAFAREAMKKTRKITFVTVEYCDSHDERSQCCNQKDNGLKKDQYATMMGISPPDNI